MGEVRTKSESIKRLRSLSRETLHKLSDEFSIEEKKYDWLKYLKHFVGASIIYTILIILFTRI